MILHILYIVSFIIALICFPATLNDDMRRKYGRIFGTRIDTKIYHKILYGATACVCVLFIIIFLMG